MIRDRVIPVALLLFLAAGCTEQRDEIINQAPMGEFLLGHNIVVADEAEVGPVSRDATPEEWEGAIKSAIDDRLGRYEGSQYYHVAIAVEGYILALPGVPVVANPKSALIITATVWDDAAGGKINEEPEQFTVFESLSADTIFSSGLTRTKEEQMADLSANAARLVHEWMVANADTWFAPNSDATVPEALAETGASVSGDAPIRPRPRPG